MIPADSTGPEMRVTPELAQCIEISGTDAHAFAQSQFSGDVRTLRVDHWQWNAWLDAKGAVRALMHLADPGDGRLLAILRGGDAQSLCTELRRYVFRSKVSLQAVNGWHRHVGSGMPTGTFEMEHDAVGFGYGDRSLWLKRIPVPASADSTEALRLADIENGWPTLPPGEHAFLPPALGLEHLGAVSFGKGCYPGQEIAARLHYRGGHKLRLCHVRAEAPLAPGRPLSPAQPRAVVLDALVTEHGCEALAVLEENAETLPGVEILRRFEA